MAVGDLLTRATADTGLSAETVTSLLGQLEEDDSGGE